MANLKIAANYITTMGNAEFHYGHLQIVHGSSEIEVQAPYSADFWNNFPNFGFPGVRAHTDPDHTEYASLSEEGDAQRYAILDVDVGNRDPDKVWELLDSIHAQFVFENPGYLYGLGQNSNSYASTLLWMVGIDASAYIPGLASIATDINGPSITGEALAASALSLFNVSPTDGDLFQLFPGADRNILTDGYGLSGSLDFDLRLQGTSDDDFIQTGSGEDTLLGGLGHDTIKGGSGSDTIVGDQGADVLFGGEGYDLLDYSGNLSGADNSGSLAVQATLFWNQEENDLALSVSDNWGSIDYAVGFEEITLTDLDDSLALSGNPQDIFSRGFPKVNAGNNTGVPPV